ncbi:MAG: NAD(+)/NADH kinase [Pseudomonadota bacterium]
MVTLGIVANPASGKDVRRLVARASVFDNPEKQAIVQRVLAGMDGVLAGTDWKLAYLDDGHGIVRQAIADVLKDTVAVETVAAETGSAIDTTRAARALKQAGTAVNITLGGDGTNRAFALGWDDAPLIPISTGTNNVFPRLMEATVAGAAAGLVAAGLVQLEEVAAQQKIIRVAVEDESDDLALIDAVLVAERFVGARALLSPENLRSALLTVGDPAAVGMTSIGGLMSPLDQRTDAGLHIEFATEAGTATRVRAPIAPGYYRDLWVDACNNIEFGQTLRCSGPGVLAFDGERERVLKPGQTATLTVERTGPWVVEVPKALRLAAERGLFIERARPARSEARESQEGAIHAH